MIPGSNLGEEVREMLTGLGSRWGDWQSWGRRVCHYWKNSRDVRKKTERQVTSYLRYTKEEVIRWND